MPSTLRRAVLFADLRGSTGLYEAIGNARASQVVTETVGALARCVPAAGGVLVKTLGDGLMAVFPQARSAVDCAHRLHEEVGRLAARKAAADGPAGAAARLSLPSTLPLPQPLQLQVSIAWGETVEMEGDFFGDAVNVAARLLDHAGDNETLVTADVVHAMPVGSRAAFRSLDRVRLRGRLEPVEVHLLSGRNVDTSATQLGEIHGPEGPDALEPRALLLSWGSVQCRFALDRLPVVVGRAAACDMMIDDARVSRSHCRIDWLGSMLQITDLSINGTFLRFSNEDEVLSLRRGSCTLHGSGEVGLSGSPENPGVAVMRFEVRHGGVEENRPATDPSSSAGAG